MSITIVVAFTLVSFFSIIIGLLLKNQDVSAIKQTQSKDINAIERLLPQTQCRDCGYNGCRPYAEALVKNETDINRCLPGKDETVSALAKLLGKETKPLYKEIAENNKASIALIDEELCIGCVKCIRACPVDAIIGAPKQMHSVINNYCTGCKLCIAPCPVDCISMVPVH